MLLLLFNPITAVYPSSSCILASLNTIWYLLYKYVWFI